ncbi:hypothetical protein LXA43DRAFT_1102396 [Ganoderma leucocontextum]|nr:hypothetical protein LXA43DRAFT_1102396 [Ganoderma leucocontextum]
MTSNINSIVIETNVTTAAPNCLLPSTGPSDNFPLYTKLAAALGTSTFLLTTAGIMASALLLVPVNADKVAVSKAVLVCAVVTSGFVSMLRAIKAMHIDLVQTLTDATRRDHCTPNEIDSIPPETEVSGAHEADFTVPYEAPEDAETSREGSETARTVWGKAWHVVLVCLEQSMAAAATVATGVLLEITPDVEDELPSPVLTSQSRS